MPLFKTSLRIWQMLKAPLCPATHQLITSNLHVLILVKTQTPFAKCHWERSDLGTGLVGKISEVKPLGMLDLRTTVATRWQNMDWIHLALGGQVEHSCDYGNENARSIKCGKLLIQLRK